MPPRKYIPMTAVRYGLGRRLRALRLEHKQTQTEVAKATIVTVTCVSLWELGKTEPTLSSLIMLADHFNTTIDWIVRGKQTRSSARTFRGRTRTKSAQAS
jgi:transcriptional regulator with XRE-family HTH domain